MINSPTMGDVARTFRLQNQVTDLRQKMTSLTSDLSAGQSIAQAKESPGGILRLGVLEHDIVVVNSQRLAAREAQVTTSAMQTAMERVQTLVNDLASTAVLAAPNTGDGYLELTAQQARADLDAVVAALNSDTAGRALFAGADVTWAPLAKAEDIMTIATNAAAGTTTAADVMAALSTVFETPGGPFETLIYRGSTAPIAPFRLGSGESVALDLRADDPVLRDALMHTVAAALVSDPGVPLSQDEQHALARRAAEGLMDAEKSLVGIRADLGHAESRIETATSRLSAELVVLEQARADLIAVDPYETATELQSVQTQIETLYAITARSSRLSLVAFLS